MQFLESTEDRKKFTFFNFKTATVLRIIYINVNGTKTILINLNNFNYCRI